jgi:putative endonuclease
MQKKNPRSSPSKAQAAPDGRKPLGNFGERVAAAHLQEKGWRIIDRNFRVAEAEIDLVADSGDAIVFVEVRTRRGAYEGMAALSITRGKVRKLLRAAAYYAEKHPEVADRPQRIDIVCIELGRDGKLTRVEHIEDAVRG